MTAPIVDLDRLMATATRLDGTRTATVDNPSGHVANPVDEPGLRAKFDQLVDDPARAAAWWPRLIALPRVPDCAALCGGADGEDH